MNIGCYCRVSTDKEDQLNSLEAQRSFFEEYAKKEGHTLVKIYADEGISGTKATNRKEFLRLMRDAHAGLFSMVIVKDISRLARNTVDLLTATRTLKSLNIDTLFLTNNMTVLGNSEFVLTLFGAMAQEESANTSKRVKFGKKRNAEQGRVPNIVYGYDKVLGDYFTLTINPKESEVIRNIFELYVYQGYGASKIAMMLNEQGCKTKRGCAWSQNAIARILKNQLYVGKIINGKQEVKDFLTGDRTDKDISEWMIKDDPTLRIIPNELFIAAQKTLAERKTAFRITHERQSNKYAFSTVIKCADCGWSFRRMERTYKNTYVRWVCSGRNGRGASSCSNAVSVDESSLLEALRSYFADFLAKRNNVISYVVKEFKRNHQASLDQADQKEEVEHQLAQLANTRQKYMDMYEDDLISREELRDKMKLVNKQIEKAESELHLLSYNLSKSDQLEDILAKTFQTIQDIVSMEHVTNAQLKQIIQKIVVDHEGKIDIYVRLFAEIGLDEIVPIRYHNT